MLIAAVNCVGDRLRGAGFSIGELSEARLLRAAQRRTGLVDFGPEEFRTPLRLLLQAHEREASLNFLGRGVIRGDIVATLVNRLRLQADFTAHPEILRVPVERPLFIAGWPRTGTTLLHRLLALDEANRALRFWELDAPSPPPRAETRDRDPRVRAARRKLRVVYSCAPEFAAVHPSSADAPEECDLLFRNAFVSISYDWMVDVPSYVEWLAAHDWTSTYHYYRQQLQLLTWRSPGERLVLKSPHHLWQLRALHAVFPDAYVVHTHRHPLEVLPSACSLASIGRLMLTDRFDAATLGAHVSDKLAAWMERGLEFRATAEPSRFCDVRFEDLCRDPVTAVRRIYDRFGFVFRPALERQIRDYLAAPRRAEPHRYTLGSFALSEDALRCRFSNYVERFALA